MDHSYDPRIVAALPEFHKARTRIPAAKQQLDDLGAIVCQHGRHAVVGLALLHTHFPLSADERLIETIGADRSVIRPVTGDDTPAVPYTWQLTRDGATGAWRWSPLEFLALTPETATFADLAADVLGDQVFLSDLAEALARRGLTEVLGLSLLHRDSLRADPAMSLLEHTDGTARTLTFTAIPAAAVDPASMYETLWHFTPGGVVSGAGLCSAHHHCSQHCTGHD